MAIVLRTVCQSGGGFHESFHIVVLTLVISQRRRWRLTIGRSFRAMRLRSGNAPAAALQTPLGLVGAVPLTDGIYAAPVVADGKADCHRWLGRRLGD